MCWEWKAGLSTTHTRHTQIHAVLTATTKNPQHKLNPVYSLHGAGSLTGTVCTIQEMSPCHKRLIYTNPMISRICACMQMESRECKQDIKASNRLYKTSNYTEKWKGSERNSGCAMVKTNYNHFVFQLLHNFQNILGNYRKRQRCLHLHMMQLKPQCLFLWHYQVAQLAVSVKAPKYTVARVLTVVFSFLTWRRTAIFCHVICALEIIWVSHRVISSYSLGQSHKQIAKTGAIYLLAKMQQFLLSCKWLKDWYYLYHQLLQQSQSCACSWGKCWVSVNTLIKEYDHDLLNMESVMRWLLLIANCTTQINWLIDWMRLLAGYPNFIYHLLIAKEHVWRQSTKSWFYMPVFLY